MSKAKQGTLHNLLFSMLLILFSITSGQGFVVCGEGFRILDLNRKLNICVKFEKYVSLQWRDARRTCQFLGADLIRIENQTIQDAIHDEVKKDYIDYWLGLQRRGSKWVWLDDTAEAQFTNFDKKTYVEPTKTDNVYCSIRPDGSWTSTAHDVAGSKLNYICEKAPATPKLTKIATTTPTIPSPPTTTTPATTTPKTGGISSPSQADTPAISPTLQPCEEKDYASAPLCPTEGFVRLSHVETCVLYVKQKMTWEVARQTCINVHSADLVRADNKNVAAWLAASTPGHTTPTVYWIGLHKPKPPGEFQWLDDTHKVSWFNWENSKLKKSSRGRNCAGMDSATGLWRMEGCNEMRYFICQQPTASSLTVGNREPPEVKLENVYGSKTAFIGTTLNISCVSFLDNTRNLYFEIFTGNKTIVVEEGRAGLLYTEDKSYIQRGDRCFLRLQIVATINVTKESGDTVITCCENDNSTVFSVCSKMAGPKLQFVSGRPSLKVDVYKAPSSLLLGGKLTASCSALVGTSGHLVWTLSTLTLLTRWRLGLDGRIYVKVGAARWRRTYKGRHDGTMLTSSLEQDDLFGPRIESTFYTSVTMDLNHAMLACQSYMYSDILVNTPDKKVKHSAFQVLVAPADSTLEMRTGVLVLLLVMTLPMVCVAGLLYTASKGDKNNKREAPAPAAHNGTISERPLNDNQPPFLPENEEVGRTDAEYDHHNYNDVDGSIAPVTQSLRASTNMTTGARNSTTTRTLTAGNTINHDTQNHNGTDSSIMVSFTQYLWASTNTKTESRKSTNTTTDSRKSTNTATEAITSTTRTSTARNTIKVDPQDYSDTDTSIAPVTQSLRASTTGERNSMATESRKSAATGTRNSTVIGTINSSSTGSRNSTATGSRNSTTTEPRNSTVTEARNSTVTEARKSAMPRTSTDMNTIQETKSSDNVGDKNKGGCVMS